VGFCLEPAFSDGNSPCSAAAFSKRYSSSSARRSGGSAICALGLDAHCIPCFSDCLFIKDLC
jgi:hypothetical protein